MGTLVQVYYADSETAFKIICYWHFLYWLKEFLQLKDTILLTRKCIKYIFKIKIHEHDLYWFLPPNCELLLPVQP